MLRNLSPVISYIFTLIYFINQYCTAAVADNTTSSDSTCSNHCSQQDSDNSCWLQTRRYYDRNLVNALDDWVTVEINIDQWNKRHGSENPPENSTTLTVERIYQQRRSGSLLDVEHLEAIVSSLLNLTYSQSTSIHNIGIPEFVCPIPCGYESKLWLYLFIASILVNIAMLLVVIPFIVKSERRDKKLYAKQVSVVQMLRPASKTRIPSTS